MSRRDMGLFKRYNPVNRIYLAAIDIEGERLPEDRTGVLCCDSEGNLSQAIIETSVFETAQSAARELSEQGKFGAPVCIEIASGASMTFAVEISFEQFLGLEQILQAAQHVGTVPQPLRKYARKIAREIIKLGEGKVEDAKKRGYIDIQRD